jgi:hypothetical protein
MPDGSQGRLDRGVVIGAFLFLRDGRLFVRPDHDGPIRPGTDADRSRAVLALQGNHAATIALLPPGHPDAFLVPPSAS